MYVTLKHLLCIDQLLAKKGASEALELYEAERRIFMPVDLDIFINVSNMI